MIEENLPQLGIRCKPMGTRKRRCFLKAQPLGWNARSRRRNRSRSFRTNPVWLAVGYENCAGLSISARSQTSITISKFFLGWPHKNSPTLRHPGSSRWRALGSESWRCCCFEISFEGMVLVHFLVDIGNSQVHHMSELTVYHSKVGVKTLNGTTAICYNLFLCFEETILLLAKNMIPVMIYFDPLNL